jgi:ribosomal protein S18 acetylase RimI-like enzyme
MHYAGTRHRRNRHVEIRLLNERDAQALWNFRMLALQSDPWSFVESPQELQNIPAVEYATRLSANKTDHAENFVYGAFVQEKLLGMVGFYQEQPLKRRHKGWIWGVFVAPEARGQGLAKKLMSETSDRAANIPGLEIILLTVSVGQTVPRSLYESLGFRSIGIEPQGLKIGPDHLDEEHMYLKLRE